ncbi:MAG: polysaccharide deacetylase family protein [Ignavibacteriales bacterium]|nr:polysaccharide deacetylase family protein [Ignavibacteriales bacterium]
MRITGNRVYRILFPSFTYATSSADVHLTFDDGPHPASTSVILETLRTWKAKATFFLLGKNVLAHPELTRRILSEGHTIGNHSFDHPLLVLRSARFVRDQVSRTEKAILEVTSSRPTLFRPPYGFLDPWATKIVKQMGYKTVLWTTDPADFQPLPAEIIVQRATSELAPGSIILLHDSEAASVRIREFLTGILERLAQRGFTFSPLPS